MSKVVTKTYKRYSAAKTAAKGNPIIQIADLYVILEGHPINVEWTEITLIDGAGNSSGFITLHHLDRLGNGNHAKADPEWSNYPNVFKSNEVVEV